MKQFEIEEAYEIIKHISGLLLIFGATEKTTQLLREYLEGLIADVKDQKIIEEAQAEGDEISFERQVEFLKQLLVILDENDKIRKEIQEQEDNSLN